MTILMQGIKKVWQKFWSKMNLKCQHSSEQVSVSC